jgi:hypothetical protein
MAETNAGLINFWHSLRRFVFGVYGKRGYDAARDVLKERRMSNQYRSALTAELIFYEKYKNELQLDLLLDVDVKADSTGIRNSRKVNFDITTNLDYKKIDDYLKVTQDRKKTSYEIVLVNPKTEEMVWYPLRFARCKACNNFSHYILYIQPSTTRFHWDNHESDQQSIVQYCSHCKNIAERQTFDYVVTLLKYELDLYGLDEEEENRVDLPRRKLEYGRRLGVSAVKAYEKDAGLLISGVVENAYNFTSKEEGSYWGGLYWSHPLAKDLGDGVPFYYGIFTPTTKQVRELLGNPVCKKCNRPLTINPKLKLAGCVTCGTLGDYGESLVYHGYSLQRLEVESREDQERNG